MAFFLPYKSMWDMPLTAKTDEKHIPHWFGNVAYVVVGAVCKVCFRYKVEQREKLRAFKDRGLLLVCPHRSFLDVVFIYLSVRWQQWVRLVGRDSLFSLAGGLFGQILSRVGSFPVKRDSADRSVIKRSTKMLRSGELVCILPEGTRRGKSGIQPSLHAGAGFIAKRAQVPLMPMAVRNAGLVKQKGKFIRFKKISVVFGDPILLDDFEFIDKKDRLEAYTWYAMRECFALDCCVPAEQVDMKELFPESFDYAPLFSEHPIPSHDAIEYAAHTKQENKIQ